MKTVMKLEPEDKQDEFIDIVNDVESLMQQSGLVKQEE